MTDTRTAQDLKSLTISILKNEPLLPKESQQERDEFISKIEKIDTNSSEPTLEYFSKLHVTVEEKYKKYNAYLKMRKLGFARLEVLKPVFDDREQNFVLGLVEEVKMNGPHFTIGKDDTCNLCLSDISKGNVELENGNSSQTQNNQAKNQIPETTLKFVSKVHCTICYDDVTGTFYLINHSRNGTLVDGFLVTTEPFVLSGSVSQRVRGPLDELPIDSVNEIRIGEILLGKDPLFFTINTCVVRIYPLDIKPQFVDNEVDLATNF